MRVIDLSGEQFGQLTGRCYLATGADPDGADARHLQPGEGHYIDPDTGEPMFVIRDNCPLHGHITTPDPAHNPANPRSDAARGEPHTRAHNGEGA